MSHPDTTSLRDDIPVLWLWSPALTSLSPLGLKHVPADALQAFDMDLYAANPHPAAGDPDPLGLMERITIECLRTLAADELHSARALLKALEANLRNGNHLLAVPANLASKTKRSAG